MRHHMTIIRVFILALILSLFACGPTEDSLEGRYEIYSEQIKKSPKDPTGHYELGKVYIEKKEFHAALNQLIEATRLKEDYGEAYREKGIAQFYLKRYLDAEKSLIKSFELNPSQPNIATDLGSVYLKNGNKREAFRYLKIAQQRNNNPHIVFNNLGAAYAKKGKNREALKFWRKALEKNPNIPETHVNIGVVHEKMGKKKKAIASYQKALELDEYNAMAHYNLGVIYAKEKKFSKAVEEWETAYKLDKEDNNILNSLAWAYEKLGNKDDALIKLDESIKLSPYDPKTHFSSGRIKSDLGDIDNAINSLKKATHLDPNYGDAYYRMGLAYDSENQSYDAISSLLIAEIIYHKNGKMDLHKKVREKLETFFEKYRTQRADFDNMELPETLKGYDLHKRPTRIRTSKE
ncbi:MAG: tetratricopeptide repeat protein [Nitrospinae bacterium]|nr:tetratricopeptide repeat protein [Nitrospinota bacterium]